MFLALIKKDLLLIRRYVVLLIVLNLSVPFMMTMNTSFVGPMGFFIIVSATAYIVLIATGAKEVQYPRAASLLCAAPYSRRMMVLSKYVIIFLPYGFSCAAFWGMSLLKPQIGGMTPGMAIMGFLILAVAVGIYMPLQFRFGYEKARYLIMAAYLVLVCGAPMLLSVVRAVVAESVRAGALQIFSGLFNGAAAVLEGTAPATLAIGLLVAGIAVLAVSVGASVAIYERVDLE